MNIAKCLPKLIGEQIDELGSIRDKSLAGYTRRSFTPEYLKGRDFVQARMKEAGLSIGQDAAANIIARWEGANPQLAPIMFGSHSDSVPAGGRFDGMAGVLGAIEAVRLLHNAGWQPQHPIEIVDFLAEEPSEFGISTVGSRGMVGNLSADMLASKDGQGRTLVEGIREMGGDPDRMLREVRKPGDVAAYIEMHIEQGRRLFESKIPLGVVTRIAGIRRYLVTVQGETDHAGATEMSRRRDALTAASEIILALEKLARAKEGRNVVATVGKLNIDPNSPNVVPGRAIFTAEVRSIWAEELAEIAEKFKAEASRLAGGRRVEADLKLVTSGDPVVIADSIQALLLEACQDSGQPVMSLPSGAGHDTNQLARIAPAGMLFIPSINGKSHCPEEETDFDDVAKGVDAIVHSMLRLDAAV